NRGCSLFEGSTRHGGAPTTDSREIPGPKHADPPTIRAMDVSTGRGCGRRVGYLGLLLSRLGDRVHFSQPALYVVEALSVIEQDRAGRRTARAAELPFVLS